jgi:hypothetical protein
VPSVAGMSGIWAANGSHLSGDDAGPPAATPVEKSWPACRAAGAGPGRLIFAPIRGCGWGGTGPQQTGPRRRSRHGQEVFAPAERAGARGAPPTGRERLQLAAEQLLTSDGWKSGARPVAGRARATAISSQLLVALARPDATSVAGFNTWLRLGYAVRKGERAVAIIARLPVKERDRMTGEETGETMMLFKTVFVFDRAQVDPMTDASRLLWARRASR